MDARKFASRYIKPDNVRAGPIQARIVNVFEDERYNRLMLEFQNGSQFALNDGNTGVLMKAWGYNTDTWIGLEIALELGTYKDWRAEPPVDKETVKVRAISVLTATTNGSSPASKPLLPKTQSSPKDDNGTILL